MTGNKKSFLSTWCYVKRKKTQIASTFIPALPRTGHLSKNTSHLPANISGNNAEEIVFLRFHKTSLTATFFMHNFICVLRLFGGPVSIRYFSRASRRRVGDLYRIPGMINGVCDVYCLSSEVGFKWVKRLKMWASGAAVKNGFGREIFLYKICRVRLGSWMWNF